MFLYSLLALAGRNFPGLCCYLASVEQRNVVGVVLRDGGRVLGHEGTGSGGGGQGLVVLGGGLAGLGLYTFVSLARYWPGRLVLRGDVTNFLV